MHKKHSFFQPILAACLLAAGAFWLNGPVITQAAPPAVGEPIPTISCTNGMTAVVYADNLSSPDGLAFDSAGNLFVAEETAGRITQINSDGSKSVIMTGLSFPEGIAFDNDDTLYVVEDIDLVGTLKKRTSAGIETVIDNTLSFPEGVAIGVDGKIYVTASDAEKINPNDLNPSNATDFHTYLYAYESAEPHNRTTLLDLEPPFIIDLQNSTASLDQPSFSGITIGPDGMLYVASESSGIEVMTSYDTGFPFGIIDITIASNSSVFKVDPAAAPSTDVPAVFVENSVVPEGVRFQNSGFPLLIAEEGKEDPPGVFTDGKLLSADSTGSTTVLCTGFGALEDVIVGADGSIYLSEDNTSRVIKLSGVTQPPTETPTVTATQTATSTATPTATQTSTSTPTPTAVQTEQATPSVTPTPTNTAEPSGTIPTRTPEPPTETEEHQVFLPLLRQLFESLFGR